MTASGDLQPLTGDAASSPPAAEERIALVQPPPCLPPQQPEKAGRRVRFTNRLLDRLLMVGVVALAFLLASLPARNSDVWMDLATGRLLAHGQYRFGVDPFSFTSNGARWVNPSWLYDLLSFVLFQAGGGGVLVVAKAVLIALLGWILLRLSGPAENAEKGGNGWIATFFTVVALLIAGSALPLRPICVSYLFLALTIWLMESLSASDRPLPLASWGLVP
ncbi:MAG TPA: hypothetical protein VMF69_01975, partial [Gemmataceae bacterium]|nr:hypothetical protein [Gemmataceae bacterium]